MRRGLVMALTTGLALVVACLETRGPDSGPDLTTVPEVCCIADYHCGNGSLCVTDRTYQAMRQTTCEKVCGCTPCSGGGCEPEGPILECPEGTFCDVEDLWSPTAGRCVPIPSSLGTCSGHYEPGRDGCPAGEACFGGTLCDIQIKDQPSDCEQTGDQRCHRLCEGDGGCAPAERCTWVTVGTGGDAAVPVMLCQPKAR